jgi:hypothetical protein
LLPVLLFVLVFAFRYIGYDISNTAARLRNIEYDINTRAEERSMIWETDNGIYKIGYQVRFDYVFAPLFDSISWMMFLYSIKSIVARIRSLRQFISRRFK